MNKNDVALAIAKKLKRVNDDLSIILKSWKGMPGSANEPSTFDQAVVCIAADGLVNIKETLTLATGKRTLFKAALTTLNEMFLDESSTRADVEESMESIRAAIHILKGGL